MDAPLTFALACYISMGLSRALIDRVGIVVVSAGLVGLVLTALHGLMSTPNCQFDTANAWTSIFILVFFLFVYLKDGIQKKTS